MTLNTNFAGVAPRSLRLEGTERGLDAIVGLIVLMAGSLIAGLSVVELFNFGQGAEPRDSFAQEVIQLGFVIGVVGTSSVWLISTINFLIRVAVGRRSWTAPLWGIILMTVSLVVGFAIMNGAL
jgi:hypothetical protein